MPLEPGQSLGHYRIVRQIGQGGMGAVFLAEDTKLDRKVALKVLPPEMASDPDRLERFQREAKAVAALNHPHIVTIHSVEEEGGTHFLTMELVEGESLDQGLPPGGLPLDRVFDIGIALADALATAHEKGIIHRDLKPANVMLTKDGRAKVLDFGLAKLALGSPGGAAPTDSAGSAAPTVRVGRDASLTGAGIVVGTVPYMSPEQLGGETLDARTDVFSLGVVLYEIATGRRPFAGRNPAETISSILRDEPRPVTEARRDAPRHLGRIVEHCLQKQPRDRYQTTRDVFNELRALREEVESGSSAASSRPSAWPGAGPEALAASAPSAAMGPAATSPYVSAPVPTTGATSGAIGSRLWVGIVAGMVVVILVLAAFWFGNRLRTGSSPADAPSNGSVVAEGASAVPVTNSLAVLPFTNMSSDEEQEYFSDGLTEELLNALVKIPDLKVAGRTSSFSFKGKNEDLRVIGEKLGVANLLEGSVRKSGDRVRITAQLVKASDGFHLWSETYDRTLEDIFAVQDDIARSVAGALEVTLLGKGRGRATGDTQAYQLFLRGRYHWNKRTKDDMIQALSSFEQALQLDPRFALAWAGVATCYATAAGHYLGMTSAEAFPKAETAARKALELDPSLAEARTTLADTLYLSYWDWTGADREFRRALELNPRYATGHQWYAEFLSTMGRHDEALAHSREALSLDPMSMVISFSRAHLLYLARRFDESIELAERSLAQHPDYVHGWFRLGNTYLAAGDEGEAIQRWQRGLLLSGDPDTADRFGRAYADAGMDGVCKIGMEMTDEPGLRANCLARFGDLDAAFSSMEEAIDRREPWVLGLGSDPIFDPLRGTPRFDELVALLGMPG